MAKKDAFLQFLKAARSLQNQGLSKEAIVQFAKNEFGELSELFKKQIDSLFKPKKGIENIKLKDEVFDDTVVKLPIDDTGVPFNPKDPTKQYGKPKKSRMLDEDEIAELDMDIGGLEYTNDFDGTVESANKLRKERAEYIADMELEYKKGNLDPEPGSYTPQRKRFLQDRFDEMEMSGDNRLMTRDEVEELASFDLQLDMDKAVEKSRKKDATQKKIIKDFDPGDRDPSAEGGIIGFYTGGMVDVEPNLSDIGHGSDALMARTRLVSPDGQATTSTGLNYLLAEDNDNIRVPFGNGKSVYDRNSFEHKINELKAAFKHYKRGSATGGKGGTMTFEQFAPIWARENFAEGGRIGFANGNGVADEDAEKAALGKRVRELMDEGFDMGEAVRKAMSEGYAEGGRIGFSKGKLADVARRKFMKTAGAAGAGLAALKTGLLGFGKEAAPVVEKAVEAAKGVPPYFYQLVDIIKSKGREIKSYGDRVKQYLAPSKDGKSELMLTEDLNTGDIQVKKIFKENDDMVTKTEEMNFNKGQGDEATKGTSADNYEEVTSYNSRIYKDEFNDPDYVDGIDVESITKEIVEKKADGGRIGFESGKIVLGKNIYNLLKNNKKIKKAIDNIFGTGDYKLDADMAAESLVELNPKEFNNMLYEDLPDNVRSEIYGAVIGPIQNNALIASRAKKTANTIDISDPKVAEDFTNFMKNHGDPAAQKAIKELEETLLLSNAKRTKGRKDNSSGGIQTMLGE